MRFDWWTLALQTANFAVLVWLLHRFLYKPVLRMIDARKADVQKQYDDAKAAEDKAKEHLAAIETQRADIAAEREAALKAAASQAQEAAQARRAQAEREAQALLDAARKTLSQERENALAGLRQSALDLGADFASRLVAEIPISLRAEAWIERIEKHLETLPQAERQGLTAPLADGKALTVVTPAVLSPEIAVTWRDRLHKPLGNSIVIAFAADPALIAGAELHFPTAILRFSWRSALDALRAEIGADGNAR
jgi:F-type H+-transporting ATPase subunit b